MKSIFKIARVILLAAFLAMVASLFVSCEHQEALPPLTEPIDQVDEPFIDSCKYFIIVSYEEISPEYYKIIMYNFSCIYYDTSTTYTPHFDSTCVSVGDTLPYPIFTCN